MLTSIADFLCYDVVVQRLGMLCWIVGFVILAVVCFSGTELRAAFATDHRDEVTANDPPPGTILEIPSTDGFGTSIPSTGTFLLIYAGTCSGCSLSAIDPSSLSSVPFDGVLLVYLASQEQIRSEIKGVPPRVYAIADSKGDIVNQLRAIVAPRYYRLNGHRIVEAWKDVDHPPRRWLGEVSP